MIQTMITLNDKKKLIQWGCNSTRARWSDPIDQSGDLWQLQVRRGRASRR